MAIPCQEMEKMVRRRARSIKVLAKRVSNRWGEEDIHSFRVEIKKLRAFVRMTGSAHQLPKGIRRLYKAVGFVRNWQLLRKSLTNAEVDNNRVPAALQEWVENQIATSIRAIACHAHREKDLDRQLKQLASGLPSRLTAARRRLFILDSLEAVDTRKGVEPWDDDRLHEIRKVLKYLLYVWPWLGPEFRRLAAVPFGGHNAMKRLAALLGDYLDMRVRLDLLPQEGQLAGLPEPDRRFLLTIEAQWRREKERLRDFIANIRPWHDLGQKPAGRSAVA